MLKRLLLSFCLLLTQALPLTQAQAYPGYSDYNTKVRNTVGCDQNNVVCLDSFIEGKPVQIITANCWGTMCPQTLGITYAGNDTLQVYQQYLSQYSQWINSTTYPKLKFTTSLNSQSTNISFTVEQIKSDNIYAEAATYSPLSISCNYIESLGCADDNLDRTSMQDGPCDICSTIGNPFDVRNGAKYEYALDIDYPLSMIRNYSSKQRVPGMFGANWRSNYDKTLNVIKNGGIITSLLFINPTGQYIVLQSNNGTTFNALFQDQKQYKVTIENNQVKLRKPDSGYEIYDLVNQRILSETYKGKTITYQYYANGLLYRVTDDFGKYLQFSYNSVNSFVSQVTASNGDTLSYTYDLGNVVNVKLNTINQIYYEYYNGILLTGKRDGNNVKYASFTYDALGRGIENKWITSSGQDVKKYTLNYDNNTTTVTQTNGFSRNYAITSFESAKKISNMDWNNVSEEVGFDTVGNITLKKDLNGYYENYSYDNDNKINSYTRDGKTINLIWDNDRNINYQLTENTNNGTRTTQNYYDDKNNDLGIKISGDGKEQYIYKSRDSYGRLTREENDQGLVKTYLYYAIGSTNESGLLKSITSNTGAQLVINSYDSRGNPTSITSNGTTKTMTYDYKGRILTETLSGATNTYTYDTNGNMLTMQMANGYDMTMTYDSIGRLLTIADNNGGTVSLTNDNSTDEVLSTEIYQNNTLVRARNKVIDTLGRTVESWNATTRTKQLTNYYTRASMPDSTTDANGISTNYTWNSQGQNTTYNTGSDNINKEYDVEGNVSDILANNQQTSMDYDVLGRITQINSPDTGAKSFTYSKNEDTYTDSKGTVHKTVKGIGGSIVSVTHINNDPDLNYSNYETYGYDIYGRVNQIQSNNAEITYTRNSLGQISTKSQNMIVSSYAQYPVVYGYNSIGQKLTDTYPSGLVVTYGYTKGLVTSILVNGTPVVSNVIYNSMLKEPISWTLGGNTVSVNKDTDGLLTSFIDNGILNQSITTDNEGHIKAVSDNVSNNNFSVNLTDNYNLDSGVINGKTLDYTFGANHNVTWQKDGLTDYEFEMKYGSNKIESLYYGNSETHFDFQYDSNGNLRVDHKANYKYDGKNNLEYFTDKDGNMTRYFYNGLNQRIAKWIQGGQLKFFVYNESNQVIAEYDSNGAVIAEYVYFGLRPVAVKRNGSLNIVHTDYLGTPRVITSGTNGGSVVWQWKNDNPYGNNKAQGTLEFNLRFAGQYYDSESGLHYNINRTYDPETGRYLQSDPIGLAGGTNTYNYVNKNPLDSVDPLGLDGYSGTTDKYLSGAIHNPMSVPIGSLGLTFHSSTYLINNSITVDIEAGSELYELAKLKNPGLKDLQDNKTLTLTAEGLADFINKTLDLSKYDSIYLMSCNLANKEYVDKYSNEIFAQTFSNSINKKSFAYNGYVVGTGVGNYYYYSGYYISPVAYRLQYLNLNYLKLDTTYVESRNAIKIQQEFNPVKK